MGGWEAIICTNTAVNTSSFSDKSNLLVQKKLITCYLIKLLTCGSLITSNYDIKYYFCCDTRYTCYNYPFIQLSRTIGIISTIGIFSEQLDSNIFTIAQHYKIQCIVGASLRNSQTSRICGGSLRLVPIIN